MKNYYFYCASFFSFLTILCAAGPEKLDCLEKEKAITSLETAEDLLTKAEDTFPTCNEDSNSTDQSECGGKKALAYIEVSKKLISDLRENFPTCIGSKVIVRNVKHRDCSEILESGLKKSGVYTIWPSESNTTGNPLQVYCDMETDGGGWTLIQRRGEFPVQQDFFQDWETYKEGFGNITEEFWLGNENIRVLCHKGCEIRFDLQDNYGTKGYAAYQNFDLSGSNYTINISNYTGDVGDCMYYHNNYDFSTKDKGNSALAQFLHGGWWYGNTTHSILNGIYQPGESSFSGIFWYTWRKTDNLASVEIKVRPK